MSGYRPGAPCYQAFLDGIDMGRAYERLEEDISLVKETDMVTIDLGDRARDTVTGYEGIVTAITSWLNGCRRITLQAHGLHEGKPFDSYTVDESDIEILGKDPLHRRQPIKPTGGPRPAPMRATDPR